MSEALIGVVIGGVIGIFSTFVSTFAETQKWKIEKKLEHLQRERENLEKLSSEVLQKVLKGMLENDSYDVEMLSDMMVLMPKPVWKEFHEWWTREDKKSGNAKFTYMKLCVETKKAFVDVDEKIKKLIGG